MMPSSNARRRFPEVPPALGRPHVVEQLCWSEGVDVGLGQPAGKLRSRRLHSQRRAFPAPLNVLGRLAGDQAPEEEVHDAGAHSFEDTGPRLTTAGPSAGRGAGPIRA